METADFLLIGGGIVGLSLARELRRRHPDCSVILLEKEKSCGLHASGRNSGVLHAGFYYSADSLKARFTRQGNLALSAYCREKGIPLNQCGKLVVAQNAAELATLDELYCRGQANGVPLRMLSAEEARKLEPRAITFERALFSPSTSSVDPGAVVGAMRSDALREGIEVREGVSYPCPIDAGHVVNAAGLYADTIARRFGFSEHYRILPFKGLYLYSDEPAGALRTNIYPVPDIRNPFLGVHFTVTAGGHAKIGPTAIPALWREQYQGLENFSLPELLEISARGLGLLLFSGFDFQRLAWSEMQKHSARKMVSLAQALCKDVRPEHYTRWGRPGMRAQLLDLRTRKLEMDFVVQGDKKSTHVLNAVSPGFTCSLPFASWVCDQIAAR